MESTVNQCGDQPWALIRHEESPGIYTIRGLIPSFLKYGVKQKLQVVCELWLSLLVKCLFVYLGEGHIKVVEVLHPSDFIIH
jgi:hypothetical protein